MEIIRKITAVSVIKNLNYNSSVLEKHLLNTFVECL